ncbi:MAG: baseplate J/gp47 family protein [Bacillus sp. (in: Bacteria)]|nr:baseplate J/gp47 family protein [Bacillus sp. (in: firmicutes)]MCM1427135.1 baseplate J/gp47 family protein [Eubacterium sp.]
MADLEFLETDADAIYNAVITALERGVNEPLYPGDERRIFGDALVAVFVSVYNQVNNACRQKMLQFASGEVLDALGERYDCHRIAPVSAKTTLRFSVKSPIAGNIMIEEGTRATPDYEIYFKTTEAAVLQAGMLYVDVSAESVGTGENYNDYRPGTINQLVDLIPYIDFVENIDATHGGDNGEPYPDVDGGVGDEHYRERIYIAPTALSVAGPQDAYEYHVKSADSRIVDVAVLSDIQRIHCKLPVYDGKAFLGGSGYDIKTLQVKNGIYDIDYIATYATGGVEETLIVITLYGDLATAEAIEVDIDMDLAGHVLIVPLLADGKIPGDDVLQKVYEVCSAEDIRPMTDHVIVRPPEQIDYEIEITYYTTSSKEADCIKAIEGKTGAISQFVEWQSTKMGRDINPDKLRALCLSPQDGVGCTRIDVKSPEYVELKDTQVAKCKSISVKHVVEM